MQKKSLFNVNAIKKEIYCGHGTTVEKKIEYKQAQHTIKLKYK